jgi:hypothetical protein
MSNVTKITSARSVPQGPRVPRAYVGQGRDEAGARSMDRPAGSVSGDYNLLSDAAKDRLVQAGVLLAGATIVGGLLFAATQMDTPNVDNPNPSGILTSGNEYQ